MSHQLTRTYKHTHKEEDKINLYLQEWTIYTREQMNMITEERWMKFTGRLDHITSMIQVWKKIRHIRGHHTHPPTHHDPDGKAKELMRDYCERSPTVNSVGQTPREESCPGPRTVGHHHSSQNAATQH